MITSEEALFQPRFAAHHPYQPQAELRFEDRGTHLHKSRPGPGACFATRIQYTWQSKNCRSKHIENSIDGMYHYKTNCFYQVFPIQSSRYRVTNPIYHSHRTRPVKACRKARNCNAKRQHAEHREWLVRRNSGLSWEKFFSSGWRYQSNRIWYGVVVTVQLLALTTNTVITTEESLKSVYYSSIKATISHIL